MTSSETGPEQVAELLKHAKITSAERDKTLQASPSRMTFSRVLMQSHLLIR
jgi:hypothetical protein